MQIVELLLSKAQPLKVGEVSLIDGKKSMCINVDGYFGGGQGPVWASEGTKILFTTHNHCALMEGICTKVYPDSLNVTIELTKANTWGKYVTGTKVRLHTSSIQRYHLATSETEILLESSRKVAAEVFNKKAFHNISHHFAPYHIRPPILPSPYRNHYLLFFCGKANTIILLLITTILTLPITFILP